MDDKLQAFQLPIQKVFSTDHHFEIPPYQRPYAWEEEQVDQLIDDLLRWCEDERGKQEKDRSPYFLGSVVLVRTAPATMDVVDGQQRLTTLVLLFAAACARLPTMQGFLIPFLRETGNPLLNTEDRHRLLPRARDRAFFLSSIVGPGGITDKADPSQLPESQGRLLRNARQIAARLAKLTTPDATDLIKALLNHCYLVVVSTSDFQSAYRIFSVLNDRGLDLSPTDIIKARVVEGVAEALRDQYTKSWEDVEESLGRAKFLELFSHIRMVHAKAKLRNLLDEMTATVLPKYAPIQRFIDEQVKPYSDAMMVVQESSFVGAVDADKVNQALRHLRLLDNVDWVPPALACLVQWGGDGAKVARFLTDLERLAASFMLRRTYVNDRIDRYAKVLHEIEAGADLHRPDSALQLDPAEKLATLDVLKGDIYGMVKVRLPLLLRLDSLLSGGGATYNYDVLTIEHVLPQNPEAGSQWLTDFPDPAERLRMTNQLGNLVLLTRRKNSAANNRAFDKKKAEYFVKKGVSPFAITTSVVAEANWTPAVVQRRQADAVAKLATEWRLT